MFWLKSCPKCGGDVYAEGNHPAAEMVCLQCGNVVSGEQRILLVQRARENAQRRARERTRRPVAVR